MPDDQLPSLLKPYKPTLIPGYPLDLYPEPKDDGQRCDWYMSKGFLVNNTPYSPRDPRIAIDDVARRVMDGIRRGTEASQYIRFFERGAPQPDGRLEFPEGLIGSISVRNNKDTVDLSVAVSPQASTPEDGWTRTFQLTTWRIFPGRRQLFNARLDLESEQANAHVHLIRGENDDDNVSITLNTEDARVWAAYADLVRAVLTTNRELVSMHTSFFADSGCMHVTFRGSDVWDAPASILGRAYLETVQALT